MQNHPIHDPDPPILESTTPPSTASATEGPTIHPLTHQSANPTIHPPDPEPWPEPVDGSILLNELARTLARFVVLPDCAQEALALWILHTYAFQLRDVTAYVAIESPEKRCGKTTLLSLLEQLVHRPVASSNISPSAFFRVIKDLSPTLLIDEADTFLKNNNQLKGILNSGYSRKTAFVFRTERQTTPDRRAGRSRRFAPPEQSEGGAAVPKRSDAGLQTQDPRLKTQDSPCAVARFSCWCPKVMAAIGRLPDTLADRCIVIRMQRKTADEHRERSRLLDPVPLSRMCARFILDHAAEITSAQPEIPAALHDRAADIWEPLLVLADLAGGDWPAMARHAAVTLAAAAQENNPLGSLFLDILILFTLAETDRLFTRDLLDGLNTAETTRPWMELLKGKAATDIWLAQQLRPYGIRPTTIWAGEFQAKGYLKKDFHDAFRRYIPKSELQALKDASIKPTQPAIQPEPLNPDTVQHH